MDHEKCAAHSKIGPAELLKTGVFWQALFTIGKVLIGLYLGKSSLASGFGAAGSLVVLLAWVYYSAQIFLFGAEYTWVYANRHGSRVQQPAPGDAPVVPSHSGE